MPRKFFIFICIIYIFVIYVSGTFYRNKIAFLKNIQKNNEKKFINEKLYIDLFLLYYEENKCENLFEIAMEYGRNDKIFGDIIIYKSAEKLEQNKKRKKARKLFYTIIKKFNRSRFYKDAYFNLGKSYFKSNKIDFAIPILKKYVRKFYKHRSEAYFILGKSYLLKRENRRSLHFLKKIVNYSKNNKLKLNTALLISNKPYLLNQSKENKKLLLKILSILLKNRKLNSAQKIIYILEKYKNLKQKNTFLYLKARYFFLKSNYKKSEKILERLIRKNIPKKLLLQCLILTTRIYTFLKEDQKDEKLLEFYLLKKHIFSYFLLDELISIKIKNGRIEKSEKIIKKIIHGKKLSIKLKLYKKLAILYLKNERLWESKKYFKKILRYENYKYLKRKIDFREIRYLYSILLSEIGERKKAKEIISKNLKYFYQNPYFFPSLKLFKEVSNKDDVKYYLKKYKESYQKRNFSLALKFLTLKLYLDGDRKFFKENFTKNLKKYEKEINKYERTKWLNENMSFLRISTHEKYPYLLKKSILLKTYKLSLIFLKLTSLRELRKLTGIKGKKLKILKEKSFMKFYKCEKNYPKTIFYSFKLLKDMYPLYYPYSITNKELLKFSYPIFYKKYVMESSTKNNVDPMFIFALIREESKFDKFAHSITSAKGLMQLMDETAEKIVKKNNLNLNLSDETLYNPEENIRIGTIYVKHLLNRFKELQYIASAYNSGEKNTEKWIENYANTIPEPIRKKYPYLFLTFIKFRETKNYVKKVLNSYFFYNFLYKNINP